MTCERYSDDFALLCNESDLFRVAVCLLLKGPEGKLGPPGNRGRHGKKVRIMFITIVFPHCETNVDSLSQWMMFMFVSLFQQYSVHSQGERGLQGALGEIGAHGDAGRPGELGPKGARGTRGAPVSGYSFCLSSYLTLCMQLFCSHT